MSGYVVFVEFLAIGVIFLIVFAVTTILLIEDYKGLRNMRHKR